ncbi:YncE family protein [Thioclava sp. JM3]|uniref:YncE family protein n=1 Tax=Thioclava sp. JM3 TaxID=1973004 RepID=UPI001F0AE382|nr:YncE family protein [Thioclava sp. JM3]
MSGFCLTALLTSFAPINRGSAGFLPSLRPPHDLDHIKVPKMNMSPRIAYTLATLFVSAPALAAPPTVFIPEGSANSVLMVQAETGKVLRRINDVEAVHGLAGAPGVSYLVAGSYSEIPREDVASLEKPSTVSADDHAAHHAPKAVPMGPPDAGISLLSILEAKNGDILRRIEVPGAVHHTAVSPDGRFAVATHPTGDGISVIDLASFGMTAFVPTGSMPNYAAFGTDPNLVYVSNTGNGTISEVDLSRGIVRRNLIAGDTPEHMAVSPETDRLYVADAGAGQVLELSLSNGDKLRNFDIGGEIHGLGLSNDGATLFVAGREEGKLASVSLATGEVHTAPLAPEPYHLTVIPDSDVLYVSSRAEPKVWIVDAATLRARGTVSVEGEGHQMVALP